MEPIPFSPPEITEADITAVAEVLRSGWITTGPVCAAFEQELAAYCGAEGAVCLSSATAALELVLRVLEIGSGDEVLVPAFTYTATASAVCHTGARPLLIDCDPVGCEMDYDAMERAITPRTKAVIPVDYAGLPCDYARILAAVERKSRLFFPAGAMQQALGRVAVIADAAHSLGGSYRGVRTGAIADFSCFSFHAVKNLTTGEGGAVLWRAHPGIESDALARRLRLLALHGQTKDARAKQQAGGWEYDILEPAYKMNLTDLQAALDRSQLARYADILSRRRQRAMWYDALLEGSGVVPLGRGTADRQTSAHLYPVWVPWLNETSRADVLAALAQAGIAANVHYKPLPLLTAYRNLGWRMEQFPQAMRLYRGEITLPLYQQLTHIQIRQIVKRFLSQVESAK